MERCNSTGAVVELVGVSTAPTGPASPSRARRILGSYPVRLVSALVLVIVGGVIAAQLGLADDEPSAPAREREPVAVEQAPAAAAPQRQDAVLLVGTDIAPGTYRTQGAVDGYCMCSRHSSASGGSMDDIIASDGARSGQLIVTIEPTDVRFRTRGCAPWERIG